MSNRLIATIMLCLPAVGSFAAHTIAAGEEWQPIEQGHVIEPGSALDFSAWIEAPAGRYGAVIANKKGEFEFEKRPGEAVRFRGVNLCFDANFPAKADAESLARRLRQMGYNAVRIHHYDVLVAGGWHPADYVTDRVRLDQLDYLLCCMRSEGLYISTDLFTIRKIKAEALKAYGAEDDFQAFKALVPLLPAAMEEWKRFARDILTHRNPYTGMTWAEDPALFSICPVNEDTLYDLHNQNPSVAALSQKLFAEWCGEKSLDPDDKSKPGLFVRFLTERHRTADLEMRRFLKEELNVKALISGNNWKTYQAQTVLRSQYDYVDNHSYWDHPAWSSGPHDLPYRFPQKNAVAELAFVPRNLFLTRIPGKPFVVTEFNYCFPNQYRAQGGPLMGAYAALQGWNGLFRFNWSDGIIQERFNNVPIIRGFDFNTDPVNLLSEYIIGFFWQRNDLPVLQDEMTFSVTDESAFAVEQNGKPAVFPEKASLPGLTHRIGSVYKPAGNAARLNADFLNNQPRAAYRTAQDGSTVEIEKAGNFLASTPQSIALVLQTRSMDTDFVPQFDQPAVVFCGSIDSLPLEKSKRLLVLHLTNVLNTGIRFSDPEMKNLEANGTLPLLVRRGSARLAVPNAAKTADIKIFALDLSGRRIREVPFSIHPDSRRIEFTVQTIAADQQTCMAYEILRTK